MLWCGWIMLGLVFIKDVIKDIGEVVKIILVEVVLVKVIEVILIVKIVCLGVGCVKLVVLGLFLVVI